MTSRDPATDRQPTFVAKAPDNGDGGDCGLLDNGTTLRGAGASDNGGAGDSGPLDKGRT